jgi:hypothetical protein
MLRSATPPAPCSRSPTTARRPRPTTASTARQYYGSGQPRPHPCRSPSWNAWFCESSLTVCKLIQLGIPLKEFRGSSTPEVAATYDRTYEICVRLGDTTQLYQSLRGPSRRVISQRKRYACRSAPSFPSRSARPARISASACSTQANSLPRAAIWSKRLS